MAAWCLIYDEWDPKEERLREALCTTGNGYFATRGAGAEAEPGGRRYPGTYLTGGFNRLKSEIDGREVENEDLVNWPNWLALNFRPKGGRWFDLDDVELISFEQKLDLKVGLLSREIRFRDFKNRETLLKERRFVSMKQPHLAAVQWEVTPLNWSGEVKIKSVLDGEVANTGVARYRDLNSQHLELKDKGKLSEDTVFLQVKTSQSELSMCQAARTRVFQNEVPAPVERQVLDEKMRIGHVLELNCTRNSSTVIEKVVSVYTSRDSAISHPQIAAEKEIRHAGNFDEIQKCHEMEWDRLWRRCDIILENMSRETMILRLHIFHLLQTVSMNTIDQDVGVPARGLHGEAYRGHIFWDELFIFPFLNLRIPELTRSLIMYRYRRLEEARRLARSEGFEGAMFPWQSGSDGHEESQVLHLNPKSGRWIPDNTHKQRHINAAILYNTWNYFQATNDIEFLEMYGAELCLEIARFWVSATEYDAQRKRYEIKDVVGPDEFHTAYPEHEESGVNNNAYTNFMASWSIRKALRIFEHLSEDLREELLRELGLTKVDILNWEKVSRKLFIPFHDEGLILQFEGYDDLEELDWEHYRSKYGDIQRLDRILESEGKDPNRYKMNKQADVLMLFYLFSAEELGDGFDWLGYQFNPQWIPKNIKYYISQSSNGSTLSRVVHAWVLARSEREKSWKWFQQALESDISDIQGGSTAEGIHLGAMAGTVDLVQACYSGIEMRDEVLWFNPKLPEDLTELKMRIHYRGHWMILALSKERLHIWIEKSWAHEGKLGFKEKVYSFKQDDEFEFDLREEKRKAAS
jgi:trehalose/maltose hydrolase-like predicted phosphorylase